MNRQVLPGICLWAASLATPSLLPAAALFSNFGAGSAYNTALGNVVGNAFDGNAYAEGSAFSPVASAKLNSLDLALSCFATCPDNFVVSLTSSSSDAPSSLIESFTVSASSLGSFGSDNALVDLTSVLHPVLIAGVGYWVTVTADTNDSIEWNLNSIGDAADQAISSDGGASWVSPSGQTPGAFDVVGTPLVLTPEPASFGLLAFAGLMLGLAGTGRRTIVDNREREVRATRPCPISATDPDARRR